MIKVSSKVLSRYIGPLFAHTHHAHLCKHQTKLDSSAASHTQQTLASLLVSLLVYSLVGLWVSLLVSLLVVCQVREKIIYGWHLIYPMLRCCYISTNRPRLVWHGLWANTDASITSIDAIPNNSQTKQSIELKWTYRQQCPLYPIVYQLMVKFG